MFSLQIYIELCSSASSVEVIPRGVPHDVTGKLISTSVCHSCFSDLQMITNSRHSLPASSKPANHQSPYILVEPPQCVNGDFSLNCLQSHVLIQPSNCEQTAVRLQCCRSCSSLFYARLAAGNDIEVCPYGDKSEVCFNNDFDCSLPGAKETCCDTCSGYIPPTTTPARKCFNTFKQSFVSGNLIVKDWC